MLSGYKIEGADGEPAAEARYDAVILAQVLIDDAIMVLQEKIAKDPKSHRMSRKAWEEAVYWFFYDMDPLAQRVCSLNWCVMVLNAYMGWTMNADRLREMAAKLSYLPKGFRLKRHGRAKIIPLRRG